MQSLVLFLFACSLAAAPAPVRVLIAYHSRTGNTEKMAAAIGEGAAAVVGVQVTLRKIAAVTNEEIVQADGIVLGTPVEWATLSAETKAFLDRIGQVLSKPAPPAFGEGRTAGVFCTAGTPSNGQELARLSAIAAFLALRFVIIGGVNDEGFGSLGPQAATAGKPPGPTARDLADARRFGERFARLTLQLRRQPLP